MSSCNDKISFEFSLTEEEQKKHRHHHNSGCKNTQNCGTRMMQCQTMQQPYCEEVCKTNVVVEMPREKTLPLTAADYYGVASMTDGPITVNPGTEVTFPTLVPMTSDNQIMQLSPGIFKLITIGLYRVNFLVDVASPGQLVVRLNGVEMPWTVVGRLQGSTQIVGNFLVPITIPNSIIGVYNPTGNSPIVLGNSGPGNGMQLETRHLVFEQIKRFDGMC